ncbi:MULTISPECIES: hypothetical protein [Bacillus cereus group]|uniref:Uncharacterized protein n=1 Tax=Bacillus thuringiensis TaxID=1428 RepID=A0A1C4EN27_BACTU|nr:MULTISPECIES: hypothetical protein [Bacillus cereus group]EOO20811.1 hypothetical protein IG9_00433 [Bacillus cereus HuA2-9]MED3024467.1 hypothetical protein [Bacillus wiedmannii]OTY02895.1 hypothetical protein BK729_06930 [Bacillus thuringiensis serovar wratislaviensis]OUB61329.1 hypothetical protein BK743_08230 [Bacillus thuringiensis serovar sylvestriensis]SCC44931.1 Uncharacterized protein BTT61001_03356 [Bacillus thuringiensis]
MVNLEKKETNERKRSFFPLIIAGSILIGGVILYKIANNKVEVRHDQPKQVEKLTAKYEEKVKKEEAKKSKEAQKKEVDAITPAQFDLSNDRGLYGDRGMLHIGSFNALNIGDDPEKVAHTLDRNAEYARRTKVIDNGKEVDVIEYSYSTSFASVGAYYLEEGDKLRLHSADHISSDTRTKKMTFTTLKSDGSRETSEKEARS